MQRINPRGCGYEIKETAAGKVYICTPTESLKPLFAHTYVDTYATPTVGEGSGDDYHVKQEAWVSGSLQGTLDNYSQIPQVFEGFVMTLTPIIDMNGDALSPEVPELECRVSFDPFVTASTLLVGNTATAYTADPDTVNTGFLDMYNNVTSARQPPDDTIRDHIYRERVYMLARTNDELSDTVIDITGESAYKISTQIRPFIKGSTHYVDGIGFQFVGDSLQTLTAGPGILEPMLDTAFPHINLDTITGPDALGDFTMWEFDVINQWKKLVDIRLNDINVPRYNYNKINGALNLEGAKNIKSPCDNFQIYRYNASISPIQTVNASESPVFPGYCISDGIVYIDGERVEVSGVHPYTVTDSATGKEQRIDGNDDDPPSKMLVPFIAYLDVYGGSASVYTEALNAGASSDPVNYPSVRQSGHTYVYIGAVREVVSNDIKAYHPADKFVLYQIDQGDCITDVITSDKDNYVGPFVVKYDDNPETTGSSDKTLFVTGFDVEISGGVTHSRAGKIFLDGEFVAYGEVKDVPLSPETGSTEENMYVYAHVRLKKNADTDKYEYDGCFYDTEETYEIVDDDDQTYLAYTTRLARILDLESKVPEESEIPVPLNARPKQIHYGDLYLFLNNGEISGGTSTVTERYMGPFRVQGNSTITGSDADVRNIAVLGLQIDTDDNGTAYAGNIYYNGALAEHVPVMQVVVPKSEDGGAAPTDYANMQYVYGHIDIRQSNNTIDCLMACTTKDTRAGYAGYTHYVVRLAAINGKPTLGPDGTYTGAYNIVQAHYGDIYLYGDNKYHGPFKVLFMEGIGTQIIGVDVVGSGSDSAKAGKIYIDGVQAAYVAEKKLGTADIGDIYAHIKLTKGATGYTYNACEFDNKENTTYYGYDVYTVRLGRVTKVGTTYEVEQYHYGDIYVDSDQLASQVYDGGESYEGPFKLFYGVHGYTVGHGTGVYGETAGNLYLDGKFVTGAPIRSNSAETSGEDQGSVVVYAKITDGTNIDYAVWHTPGTGSTNNAVIPAADNETIVRLGSVYKYDGFDVVIGGQTVDIRSLSDGSIVAGATVTAINGHTVTYNYTNEQGVTTTGTATTEAVYKAYQYHHGDIYTTTPPAEYNGPFHVYVKASTAFIDCPICLGEGTGGTVNIAGYYIKNGATEPAYVETASVTGVAVTENALTKVFLSIKPGTDNDSVTLSTSLNTAPTAYNVLLAQVAGTAVRQMHYGNIYIDGRWM